MENFVDIISQVGSIINPFLISIITLFMFYDAKKRKELASASKAEIANISSFAVEWKNLYESDKKEIAELNAKIDSLYDDIRELRNINDGLQTEKNNLVLKNQALEFMKCEVRGCPKRQPPSEYM